MKYTDSQAGCLQLMPGMRLGSRGVWGRSFSEGAATSCMQSVNDELAGRPGSPPHHHPFKQHSDMQPREAFLPLKERPHACWLGHLQLSLQVRARAHGPTDGHLLCQPPALGVVTALQRAHPGHSLHSLFPCNTATWWPALHCPASSPFRGFRTQDPRPKWVFFSSLSQTQVPTLTSTAKRSSP